MHVLFYLDCLELLKKPTGFELRTALFGLKIWSSAPRPHEPHGPKLPPFPWRQPQRPHCWTGYVVHWTAHGNRHQNEDDPKTPLHQCFSRLQMHNLSPEFQIRWLIDHEGDDCNLHKLRFPRWWHVHLQELRQTRFPSIECASHFSSLLGPCCCHLQSGLVWRYINDSSSFIDHSILCPMRLLDCG